MHSVKRVKSQCNGAIRVIQSKMGEYQQDLTSHEAGVTPTETWWSNFGEDYDTSGDLGEHADLLLLDEQVTLNARTLAALTAKSQLLESAEAETAELRAELDVKAVAAAVRERNLLASLSEARKVIDELQVAARAAEAEAALARAALSGSHDEIIKRDRSYHDVRERLAEADAAIEMMRAEAAAAESEATALRSALRKEQYAALPASCA